jgi:hypothetical protein
MSTTQRHKIEPAELQQQQLNAAEDPENSEIEMTTGNVDSEYKLPQHEQHLMHVRLVKKVNDPINKEYKTEETVWKGSPALYERMSKDADKGGTGTFSEYDKVELLHDVRPQATGKATPAPKVGTETDSTKKPMRSLKDAQERYKELVGFDAPTDKNFGELKEALAHLGSEAGAGDLAALKESLAAQ